MFCYAAKLKLKFHYILFSCLCHQNISFKKCVQIPCLDSLVLIPPLYGHQDPAGIFELVEVVGNGTYGQVYKVSNMMALPLCVNVVAGQVDLDQMAWAGFPLRTLGCLIVRALFP